MVTRAVKSFATLSAVSLTSAPERGLSVTPQAMLVMQDMPQTRMPI